MKINKYSFLFVVLIYMFFSLQSCIVSNTLYSWHNYEDATYQYNKKHTDKNKETVLIEYENVIDNQYGTRKTVPPGMYAEYGYMLYFTGKKNEGLKLLNKEIELYPESEKYISRIINQLKK